MLKVLLDSIQIGEPQRHGAVTIFPILAPEDWGPAYLSLGEALEAGKFSVAEVSASGSVPELRVDNGGDLPVLLVDGEELKGAKQNRVLNTTVFVAARTTVVIPVSCTEQGRWRSESTHFSESAHCMASGAREAKLRSVSDNLRVNCSHASDQSRVWAEIRDLFDEARVHSPTGAMSDVFHTREKDLGSFLVAFPKVPGQRGLLMFHGARPVGFDLVSSEKAYGRLHAKLVKSYCIEAALKPSRSQAEPDATAAATFLNSVASCPSSTFSSPGLGTDHRFESVDLVGSALEMDGRILHAAFFAHGKENKARVEEPFAGLRQRRDNLRRLRGEPVE